MPSASSWEARVAEARVARAEGLAAQALQPGPPVASGERDTRREDALREARAALAASRQAAHPAASARALLVIGTLDEDGGALTEALALFDGLHDATGSAATRLELAELSVRSHQPAAALAWLGPLPADPAATPGGDDAMARAQVAHSAARVHHLHAAALRQSGRHDEALGRERRASLALSLVPDTEQLPLRLAVAQRLGDDYARAGDPQRALEQHARAAATARRQRDRPAELAALAGLSGDLAGLGRFRDAADHCSRAVALAQELQDRDRARELARAGLALLGALGEPHGTERWEAFDAAAR